MSDSDFPKDPYNTDSNSDNSGYQTDYNQSSFDEQPQEFDVDTWESEYVEPVPVWLKFIVLLSVLMAFSLLVWTYFKKQDANQVIEPVQQQESTLLADELGEALGGSERVKETVAENQAEIENGLAADENIDAGTDSIQAAGTVSELVGSLNELDNVEKDIRSQSNNQSQQMEISENVTSEKAVVINQSEIDVVAGEIKEREIEKSQQMDEAVKQAQAKEQELIEVKTPPAVKQKVQEVKKQVVKQAPKSMPAKTKLDESTKLAEAVKRDAEKERLAVQASNYNYTLEYDGPSLRNMSSGNWAVQLIGMYDPKGFEKFVKQVNVNHPLYIYRRARDGKMWHVAILGPFSTRAEAKAAVNSLPASLKAHRPWIKSLATIKQQL